MNDFINESSVSEKELLNFIMDNGMIDLINIKQQLDMQKKEQILQNHKHKIWQGSNGKWHTYIPDPVKGRKLINRSTREDVEQAIIDNEQSGDSFQERFEVWVKRQEDCGVSPNTVRRYRTDYNRFFAGETIEKMALKNIDSDFLEAFFIRKIKEKKIPYRSVQGIFGYTRGVFEKALRDRIIKENPCNYVDFRLWKKHCSDEKKRPPARSIITEEEMEKFMEVLKESIKQNPEYIQNYGVMLSFYTGMRVGELAALRWECVSFKDKYILVNKSEKINLDTKETYLDKTKTGKIRYVPLMDEAAELLKHVRKIQLKNGWNSEFIFANENGRVSAAAISGCIRRRCHTAGLGEKSISSMRKTFNSKLRCSGVSAVVAASILGHSPRVNEMNYTFDVAQMEYKLQLVNNAMLKKSNFL